MTLETRLSPRQHELAKLVGEGLTDTEIAVRMGKSYQGTKVLLSQTYARLGIKNRSYGSARVMLAREVWIDEWETRDLCPECRGRKFAEAIGAL